MILFRLYTPFWQARSGERLIVGGKYGEFLPKKKIDGTNDTKRIIGRQSMGLFNERSKSMGGDLPDYDWANSVIVKVHQSRWPKAKFSLNGTLSRLFNHVVIMTPELREQTIDELEDVAVQEFLSVGHRSSLLTSDGDGWIDVLRETSASPMGAEAWEMFWSNATGFDAEAHTLAKAAAKFLALKQDQYIYAPADIMQDTKEVQDILFRCVEPTVCSSESMRYDMPICQIDLACHAGAEFMTERFNSRGISVVGESIFDSPNITPMAVVSCTSYPVYKGEPMVPGNFYSFRFMNFYCLVGYAEMAGGVKKLIQPVNMGKVLAGGLDHVEHSTIQDLAAV